VIARASIVQRGGDCAHCGEPCALDAPVLESGERFCCAGCRSVWSVIRGCGLDDYYRLRAMDGERGSPVRESARARLELDTPVFIEQQTERVAVDRRRVTLGIDGLRCGACLWLIESLPRLLPGVIAARVDAGRSVIEVDWNPTLRRLSEVAHFLERIGYSVLPLRDRGERRQQRVADRLWLARLGVAAVISANTMGIAFALYGGLFHGMEPRLRAFLQWTALALAAVSVFVPGRLFLRNAWLALRSRVPHMDLPISLALLAALAGGAWSTARGGDGVYAESLAMLVLLLLAGRFVQFRSQRRAREQVELIAALLPGAAKRRCADGSIEDVPLEALERGDRVIVPVGDVAPADGRVVVTADDRSAWVDLQALTGESRPIEIGVGERCWAGARVLGRPIEIEVEAAGAESRMGRIRALVEHASTRRAPIVEFANRIAGWFLLVVLVLSAITFAIWSRIDPATALEYTVALLVVTCPCALGLATPLAIVSSLAKAARAGVLIKGGDVLERLSEVGTIVLDKTGTLTEGSMRVEYVEHVEGVGCDEQTMALAAELERHSAHPLGLAIVEWAERIAPRATAPSRRLVDGIQEFPGRGIRGTIDGRRIAVGRLEFVMEAAGLVEQPGALSTTSVEKIARPDLEAWPACERRVAERGLTPVAIALDGRAITIVGIGDPLREEAPAVVAELQSRGWRVAIASGDDPLIVARVAECVGVAPALAFGGRSPEQKLELIEHLRREHRGPLLMVGDGVNDVAAMAAADVGVALGSGTRASLEVGDACLARDGIGALPQLLDGARRTRRVIRANFLLSVSYNLVGATLAMVGVMNPLIAAIIMPISSLTVTAVALRAPRFTSVRRTNQGILAPVGAAE